MTIDNVLHVSAWVLQVLSGFFTFSRASPGLSVSSGSPKVLQVSSGSLWVPGPNNDDPNWKQLLAHYYANNYDANRKKVASTA